MSDHRWNTNEYEKRTRELYRTELHKLYPSEAWALYRTLRCVVLLLIWVVEMERWDP